MVYNIYNVQVDCKGLTDEQIETLKRIVVDQNIKVYPLNIDDAHHYFMYMEDGYFDVSTFEETYSVISFENFVKIFSTFPRDIIARNTLNPKGFTCTAHGLFKDGLICSESTVEESLEDRDRLFFIKYWDEIN